MEVFTPIEINEPENHSDDEIKIKLKSGRRACGDRNSKKKTGVKVSACYFNKKERHKRMSVCYFNSKKKKDMEM